MLLTLVIVLAALLAIALVWGWRLRSELQAERAYWQRKRELSSENALPQLFLTTAAALESGLLLLDRAYRIRFANQSLIQMLNADGRAIQGQGVITLLRDYQADTLIKAAIEAGEVQSTTFQPVLSSRTLRITCHPLADSSDYSALVLLRDITQLAQLERARREMVANVSHELRTPLASIKLLVETLQSAPPPAVTRKMLGQIDDELESMTHLVDELRVLSQIESGRMVMTLQPTDLGVIIERAVARVQTQAERRELQLVTQISPDLPLALLDAERIGQVLLNLLNNALKFTPAGGVITVAACLPDAATATSGSRLQQELAHSELEAAVLVTVSDTGIGIPMQEVERVFERFYKVDRARTRNSGGTGLGLAIVKHLVERHGGRIWVESQEGVGSTFSLLLPVA
jgi:two-component system phosphate regulon sensor histidine kinase PhoR